MKKIMKILLYAGGAVMLMVILAAVFDDSGDSDDTPVQLPKEKLVLREDGTSAWVADDENEEVQDVSQENNTESDWQTEEVRPSSNEPVTPKTIVKRISNDCNFCGGSGICTICHGSAGYFNPRTQIYYPCTACAAINPGKCKYCGGEGKQEMIVTIYPDGSATGINPKTGQTFNSVPGASNYLSSEEKSELTQSLREQGNPEYMDKVEYATDYVADNRKIYCSKCGQTTYRHTHVRVRIN